MPASFVVVPQWQGSGSARAMRLIDGAEAIRGDLPLSSTTVIDVPAGAGSGLGTPVHRLSSIQYVRDELRVALRGAAEPVVTIGGDCGVELGPVDAANKNGDVALLWVDAHPDLNTAESSPTGAFHGIVLRALLGDGPAEVAVGNPLDPSRVVLVGTRALDDAESAFVEGSGIRMLPPDQATPDAVAEALRATGAARVYVHVDLDVLDPAEFDCVSYPEPFGLSVAAVLEIISTARGVLPLAGAGITEFAPASVDDAADDLPTILRIVGALTRPA